MRRIQEMVSYCAGECHSLSRGSYRSSSAYQPLQIISKTKHIYILVCQSFIILNLNNEEKGKLQAECGRAGVFMGLCVIGN